MERGEWMIGLGLGLGCSGVGGVGWEWVGVLDQGLEGWGDVICESRFSV